MKAKPADNCDAVALEVSGADYKMLKEAGAQAMVADSPLDIREILVPIDFSERSMKALNYAKAFARQFRATLHLLHVVQINYIGSEAGSIEYPLPEMEMRGVAEKRLQNLVEEKVGKEVPTEIHVRTGTPVSEVTRAMEDLAIDLVVISTHGYTGLKHVLLGSVAESIVRHAKCPVLTVREKEHDFLR